MMNYRQRFVGSVNFENLIDEKVSQSYWVFSADFPSGIEALFIPITPTKSSISLTERG